MKKLRNILLFFVMAFSLNVMAKEAQKSEPMNVREFILHHVADSYSWHITTFNEHDISIPLPVIVKAKNENWHIFSSSRLHNKEGYKGFYISHQEKYAGKIVKKNAQGEKYVRSTSRSQKMRAESLSPVSYYCPFFSLPPVRSSAIP